MQCLLAVSSVCFRRSLLNTRPDVVLYADPSHECASHYSPSLFYIPGSLAVTHNGSAEMVEGQTQYSPSHTQASWRSLSEIIHISTLVQLNRTYTVYMCQFTGS